jgi:hypothetical protein
VEPFEIQVSDDVLADLRDRLARTRWPDEADGAGWVGTTPIGWSGSICPAWTLKYPSRYRTT